MDDPISNLLKKVQCKILTVDGDTDVEEPCMFERGTYFSVFCWLCYVKAISMDMLDEQVSENRDLDLNEEEDIRMEYSREYH